MTSAIESDKNSMIHPLAAAVIAIAFFGICIIYASLSNDSRKETIIYLQKTIETQQKTIATQHETINILHSKLDFCEEKKK